MIPTRFRSKDYLGAAPNEPTILQIVDRSGVRTRQWRHAISIGSRSIASRPPFTASVSPGFSLGNARRRGARNCGGGPTLGDPVNISQGSQGTFAAAVAMTDFHPRFCSVGPPAKSIAT
jgi:hypothetical protein